MNVGYCVDNATTGWKYNINMLYIAVTAMLMLYAYGWLSSVVARALGIAINRSRVQLPAGALPGSNSGQVVHTHVPKSPSSIIWYRPRGGDALRLGR